MKLAALITDSLPYLQWAACKYTAKFVVETFLKLIWEIYVFLEDHRHFNHGFYYAYHSRTVPHVTMQGFCWEFLDWFGGLLDHCGLWGGG